MTSLKIYVVTPINPICTADSASKTIFGRATSFSLSSSKDGKDSSSFLAIETPTIKNKTQVKKIKAQVDGD